MTDLADYRALCAAKRPQTLALGMARVPELTSSLFDHQKHGVEFALRAGRSALFYDTGLGKTRMMLEWGRHVVEAENKPVLMLAPLAVSAQHIREAERMGVDAIISRFGSLPSSPKIVVTNYERLERFDLSDYAGVILDESSILKNFSGVTTRKLIDAFAQMRWRLAGSATPAPNDHTELGTHSEFLSVMRRDEMLVRWFIHDSADIKTWRVKGHAVAPFWDWVASWARCVSKPSDLGFSDAGFDLPPLNIHKHIVASDRTIDSGEEKNGQARLFRMPERSATSIHREKRLTARARAEKCAEIVFGDWECLGSLNTRLAAASAIMQTKKSAPKEKRKAGQKSKTSSTCENITNATQTGSSSTNLINEQKTSVAVNDMQAMRNLEKNASIALSAETEKKEKTTGSEQITGSQPQTMLPCSPSNRANAPSAITNSARQKVSDSTSITVTRQERSEDCFAQTVIMGSENSKTTPPFLNEQSPTSNERDWWIIWCDTDYEQDELEAIFGDLAVSIRGSHSPDRKEEAHEAWIRGDKKIIICKPVMFGHGLNWQHCNRMVFCGLSFSYETFYQAVRRCYRFRQLRPVDAHIVLADTEAEIAAIVERKGADHDHMKSEMAAAMMRAVQHHQVLESYHPHTPAQLPAWLLEASQ